MSSASTEALVRAVDRQGGESVHGTESVLLCELASEHARDMADSRKMSHDRWDARAQKVFDAGGNDPSEIVAYTSVTDPELAAHECAEGWRDSEGHRRIMQSRYDAFCYIMVLGADGHYCIGITANRI